MLGIDANIKVIAMINYLLDFDQEHTMQVRVMRWIYIIKYINDKIGRQ